MGEGVGLEEVADALGVAHQTVRMYRLQPDASGYRRPPDGWREHLVELARGKGENLRSLAEELEG